MAGDSQTRYGLLLVSTVVLVGIEGITEPSGVQQVAVTALAGASVLLAFRAAQLKARYTRIAAAVFAITLAVSVVRAFGGGIGEGATRAMAAFLVAFGPPAVAIGVLRDLRRSGEVRLTSLMGVLSLYLLLGLFFAAVYGSIDHLGGDPFFADGKTATTAHCVYFSFTTLATVGYGDFVARADFGHTLAIFEALLGQIYLVTIVSLIVTNLRPRSERLAKRT
jgi:hypothetical protein